MTRERELQGVVRSWLHENRHEDATRVLQSVLTDVAAAPRRRATGWPTRRTPTMNKFLAIGLSAAAVVVIALIAFNLLPGRTTPGAAPTNSPSGEQTPNPTPVVGVEPGPHVIWADAPGVGSITLTIPNGWAVDATNHTLVATALDDTAILVFAGDLFVYGDPCQWSTTLPDSPATTVDELIAALGSQASRNASEPVPLGVGGIAGQSVTLHVPDDVVFADCDQTRSAR